ncbi:MAG: tyrosine-type recombinase/integrase [Verrucomicrobiota bacterium]
MNIDEAIGIYASHCEVLNFSPQSIKAQNNYLKRFGKFLERNSIADVLKVTADHLQFFQQDLYYEKSERGRQRSVTNQTQILIAVRNLYKLLHSDGRLKTDPSENIQYPKKPDRLPKSILTIKEAERVIEAPDIETSLGYRDRTILEVFYCTGIRRAELLALKLTDVNLDDELLRINHGKGAKDRVVPLSKTACEYLANYISGIRPEILKGKACDVLFVSNRRNGPIGGTTLDTMLEKYGRLARLKQKLTAHVWRHTCATHMVQNNANLRHVQEMLGHRSLVTTEQYLRLTITDLKDAHSRFHPRK